MLFKCLVAFINQSLLSADSIILAIWTLCIV